MTAIYRLIVVLGLIAAWGCGEFSGTPTDSASVGADAGGPDQLQKTDAATDRDSVVDTSRADLVDAKGDLQPPADLAGQDLAAPDIVAMDSDGAGDSGSSSDSGIPVASNISAVWANNGQDKVVRGDLRASKGTDLTNSVWDGATIKLFGAKNEVVAFNLVLESAKQAASNVSLSFTRMDGPDGAAIVSTSAGSKEALFNWVGRPIELFYVRYLQIKGLSVLAYESYYDERHAPVRFRRPYGADFIGTGGWTDRPDHDTFYPEIAVPLELHPNFSIKKGQNQSVWVDIYIPKSTPAGVYTGTVAVSEGGVQTHSLPVTLTVRGFTLPDRPSGKTMVVLSESNVNRRHIGVEWPVSPADTQRSLKIRNRHHHIAHRHRISLVGDGASDVTLTSEWVARLDGSLYTAQNGYDGPGVAVGNDVYPIGLYGGWTNSWNENDAADMQKKADAWVSTFEAQFPNVLFFLYLIDEPGADKFPQIEQWSQWIDQSSGPGKRLPTFSTVGLVTASAQLPTLDIACTWTPIGVTATWEAAVKTLKDNGKTLCLYNGHRPASGTLATEDDGVAPRVLAWTQFKKGIDFWFFWESTYYNDFQATGEQTNVFAEARTFGTKTTFTDRGEQGWNYTNGDGVLFYPGTDTLFPSVSYGVDGPFVSLRMKLWRRGLQDMDYLALAQKVDAGKVTAIVQSIIPKVLWEYGVNDPQDPSWVKTDISWSVDPDVWEAARNSLAEIIESK